MKEETTLSSQFSISYESSPSLDTEPAPTDAQRSSDWVKGLKWQSVTPEKDESTIPDGLMESTRKKRVKYKQ